MVRTLTAAMTNGFDVSGDNMMTMRPGTSEKK